jgi:hypothetical protein
MSKDIIHHLHGDFIGVVGSDVVRSDNIGDVLKKLAESGATAPVEVIDAVTGKPYVPPPPTSPMSEAFPWQCRDGTSSRKR